MLSVWSQLMAGSLPLVLIQSVVRVVAVEVPRNARDPAPTPNLCLVGSVAKGLWKRQELVDNNLAQVKICCCIFHCLRPNLKINKLIK